jgi:hypothetical protein
VQRARIQARSAIPRRRVRFRPYGATSP